MSTTAADPHTVNSQEAFPSGDDSVDKSSPSPAPAPADHVKGDDKPKNGVGAKLKSGWASLDVDIPTCVMMLK
jgi:hypothetical protein